MRLGDIQKSKYLICDGEKMGKNFRNELAQIPYTYAAVMHEDVFTIKKFLDFAKNTPILLIGSGGSFSVAVAAEYLLRRTGLFCKAITPLELPQYKNQLSSFSAILFTAGGRNPDTRNTYKYLNELEIHAILTLCMSKNAPIAKQQLASLHSMYFDFSVPCGRDGFLAVNSTIASIALLAKALFEMTNDDFYSLPNDFLRNNIAPLERGKLQNLLKKDTVIVLHGGITTSVAYDLESKFSEVALGNIQLVDFRNFAHGRHYWISTRADETAILMLVGPDENSIAKKTSCILEGKIICESLSICEENVIGLLKMFVDVFQLVSFAGEEHNIDPGCPKVAEFGRKLYHLSYNPCTAPDHRKLKKSIINAAAHRKTRSSGYYDFKTYLLASKSYLSKLQCKQFSGIIFDYDGTLHEKNNNESGIESQIWSSINNLLSVGINIGVSTGRGKSVRTELQKHIDKKFWNSIAVGYYNGSCISSLADDSQPDTSLSISADLEYVKNVFESLNKDNSIIIELRPTQLTATCSSTYTLNSFVQLCKEHLHHLNSVKFVESSHSVDVILTTSTKSDIVTFFTDKQLASAENFLFIGDSGQLGGNDFEMLKNQYSLSVDHVSQSQDTCWNFAPLGVRNEAATLFYLNHIIPSKEAHTFTVSLM